MTSFIERVVSIAQANVERAPQAVTQEHLIEGYEEFIFASSKRNVPKINAKQSNRFQPWPKHAKTKLPMLPTDLSLRPDAPNYLGLWAW